MPNKDADAIRLIYQSFQEGKSIEEIRRLLGESGVHSKTGTLISHSDILYILKNETYKGDKLLQKQAPKLFLQSRRNKNQDYESFYLKDDHEAIVSEEVWEQVQEKFRKQKELEDTIGHRGGQPHPLYGKFFCGDCASPMVRRTLKGRGGTYQKAWVCREHNKGRKGNGCTSQAIWEDEIIVAICDQMEWESIDEEILWMNVDRIETVRGMVRVVKRNEDSKKYG